MTTSKLELLMCEHHTAEHQRGMGCSAIALKKRLARRGWTVTQYHGRVSTNAPVNVVGPLVAAIARSGGDVPSALIKVRDLEEH